MECGQCVCFRFLQVVVDHYYIELVGKAQLKLGFGNAAFDNFLCAGIGTRVVDNELTPAGVPVLDQFQGKSAADGTLNVGSNVDAISGATVSSKGVTAGVNAAIAVAGVLG